MNYFGEEERVLIRFVGGIECLIEVGDWEFVVLLICRVLRFFIIKYSNLDMGIEKLDNWVDLGLRF